MTFKQLTWGVKASFRSYVQAAGGSITPSDGAAISEDGSFVFSARPGGSLSFAADGTANGSMQFDGTVTLEAHGGMLKSIITDIALEATDDGLFITITEAPMNTSRCAIAKLGPATTEPDGSLILTSEITMDGMYQIADNYPPGTPLDPVRLD
ncbi:MAG: HtaA domain-containing protein [Pseudomonadales bacterium]|nr:HtaA domain-containing protein [Pseudomonadales bacterium]